MMTVTYYRYGIEQIGMREVPSFIRMALKDSARKELFFCASKKVGAIKRNYNIPHNGFMILYGRKKSEILKLLSKKPQKARTLIEASGLSGGAVYNFLNFLQKRAIIFKKGTTYALEENDPGTLFLGDIVKIEGKSSLRRKYGISVKELELGYFLWNRFLDVAPEEGGYGRMYQNEYTLADAVHRWKTGRTDIPVWALTTLEELTALDLQKEKSIIQYHLPPGIPVIPYHKGEYKLPLQVNSDLDKVVVQLMQKITRKNLYTFPKRKKWLFNKLHTFFGEFDDSTSRIPSAIIEILKHYYGLETLDRSSACIPPRVKARWSELTPLSRITEESSLLLHIVSLSSRSSSGFEITSRSPSFLHEISAFTSRLGIGSLTPGKKLERPHFRVYLSENKVDTLRRYTHLFHTYPDLEIWMRIPLNQIAEKVVLTHADRESIEAICREELLRFIVSIMRSLERKGVFHEGQNYLQYTEEITHYFWEEKLIPSPRRVGELVSMQVEEESLVYTS